MLTAIILCSVITLMLAIIYIELTSKIKLSYLNKQAKNNKELNIKLKHTEDYVNKLNSLCDKLAKERDEFESIAKTHTYNNIDYNEIISAKIWDDRPYESSIQENLDSLAKDLEAFGDREFRLDITIQPWTGYFRNILGDSHRELGYLKGNRFKIIKELTINLMHYSPKGCTPEYIFSKTKPPLSENNEWVSNSPITFKFSLTELKKVSELSSTIEVLKTKTIIEKLEIPIYMNSSNESLPKESLSSSISEDDIARIAAAVEIELKLKEIK